MWCSAIGLLLSPLSSASSIAPLTAGAQRPEKSHRLGILCAPQPWPHVRGVPAKQLHDLGYAEATQPGPLEHLPGPRDGMIGSPELAAELVRLPVDVIVTWTTP